MPAARYWRVSRFESYAGNGLSLSEVALHDAGGRVDGLAVLTATIAPASGALELLSDGLFDAAVAWSEDAASKPGFALVFDFCAGVTKDVAKVGLAGPSQAAFAHRFTLEYSADGALWSALYSPAIASKWPGASSFYELDSGMASTAFPGLLICVGGTSSSKPPLMQYRREGDAEIAVFSASPASLNSTGVAITGAGDMAASVSNNSALVRLYRRTGFDWVSAGNTDTNVNPAGSACAFSPDGVYLVATCDYSPYFMIYKRSGDTFTKLANPASLPIGAGLGCAFSADGVYLAVLHSGSPFISIYKRSGDTFTKLANPASLPTGACSSCTFSPDGAHLVMVGNVSPYITVYKRSGDTFTKLGNPASLPSSYGLACAFSPDGVYLAVGGVGVPLLSVYRRDGDVFNRLADPTQPADGVFSLAFDPTNTYLAAGHRGSPFIATYRRNVDTFTKLTNPATLPTDTVAGCAFLPFDAYGGGVLASNYSATPLHTTPILGAHLMLSGGDPGDIKVANAPSPAVRDMQDFGLYRLYGTVELAGTPNLLLRRRVQLWNQRDGRMVRETWSDATTGAWSFDYIRGGDGTRYSVVTYDHTGQKQAQIADNLEPEAM